ncbi:hypothetical protein HBB16_11265 [Pseudonocardia sp. MCCB 268]|nr:hypothetical protein [Pseudonocardia cytotoxica]
MPEIDDGGGLGLCGPGPPSSCSGRSAVRRARCPRRRPGSAAASPPSGRWLVSRSAWTCRPGGPVLRFWTLTNRTMPARRASALGRSVHRSKLSIVVPTPSSHCAAAARPAPATHPGPGRVVTAVDVEVALDLLGALSCAAGCSRPRH